MFDATDGGPAVADVDARLAKAQECLRDLHQCAPTIDVKVHIDSYHWLIAFLPAVLRQLGATIRELKTERDTWMRDALAHYGSMLSMQDELAEAKAPSNGLTVNPRLVESFVADGVRWIREADDSPSLPEPDVNNPEQCRFVSEVSRRLEPEVADGYADWERGLTAREWGQRADRLEREQAAKTAQDDLISTITSLVNGARVVGAETAVAELLDRFDITPKSADAGLLKAGEQ